MAAKQVEDIVKALKEIVEKNGPTYLSDEPFQVYTELISSGNADRKTAAALLHLLAAGLLETADPGYDAEQLSGSIRRECSINKRMADRLALILYTLYSQENRRKWRRKEKEGLMMAYASDQEEALMILEPAFRFVSEFDPDSREYVSDSVESMIRNNLESVKEYARKLQSEIFDEGSICFYKEHIDPFD